MMTNDDLCRSVYLLHLTTGLQSHKLAKLAGWSSRSITNSVKFSSPWSSAAKFCSEREGPRGTLEQREDRLRCSDNLERSFGCIFYLLCDCMNGLSQICVYRVPLKKSLAMGLVAIYIALLQPLHRQLTHIELTQNSLEEEILCKSKHRLCLCPSSFGSLVPRKQTRGLPSETKWKTWQLLELISLPVYWGSHGLRRWGEVDLRLEHHRGVRVSSIRCHLWYQNLSHNLSIFLVTSFILGTCGWVRTLLEIYLTVSCNADRVALRQFLPLDFACSCLHL